MSKHKHLSELNAGTKAKLEKIEGGNQLRQRLAAMGIFPGSSIEVMRNDHPGPFVIKVKQSKIMLGRGMAKKIFVTIL